ncbi:MAG: NTP transferase domain-containing protein [Thermodesulfobacteriota bacterium]
MDEQKVSVVILAAGKGTRMKSAQAKVMHQVFFKPMIHHVLEALTPLPVHQTVVVTGHQAERVEQACAGYGTLFARQHEQLGTGHAVLAAESSLSATGDVVMILCGDTPLIRTETLQAMVSEHLAGSHKLTVMTTVMDDPTNYGRIIVSDSGHVQEIVEEKDASPAQKKIKEINAGIYCVEKNFLFSALQQVGTDNKQGEVYLTDIIALAHSAGEQVQRFFCSRSEETLGVNSRYELSLAHATLQRRFLRRLMDQGVTCVLPDTITISGEVIIGRDTIISPNVSITGRTIIGENCHVAPFSCLVDSQLGDNVFIGEFSYLNGITVADNDRIVSCSCMNNKIAEQ